MEIANVNSGILTSAALGVEETDEEKETRKTQEEKAKENNFQINKKDEKDTVEISKNDLSETATQEKANNYIKNIMFTANLTEESKTLLQRYMNTFDVAKFTKTYGPFATTAEISAAMYAVTSGLIKYQE